MMTKICAGLVVVFWLVMMALLVRQEFFPAQSESIPVNPQIIVKRVFEAEDPSTLKIYYDGKEAGSARFQARRLEPKSKEVCDDTPSAAAERRSRYELSFELYLRLRVLDNFAKFHVASMMFFDEKYDRQWYSFRFSNADRWVQMERDEASPLLTLKVKEGQAPQTFVLNVGLESSRTSGSQINLLGVGIDQLLGMVAADGDVSEKMPEAKITTTRASLRMSGQMVGTYLVTLRYGDLLWFKVWIGRQGQILMVDSSLNLLMIADGMKLEEVLRDRPRPRL